MKKSKSQKGFVVLFTVFLVTIILAIAVGIANISLKEIILSKTAGEASGAFLAADSGVECALYHDIVLNTFNGLDPLVCGGIENLPYQPAIGDGQYSYDFFLPIDMLDSGTPLYCAYVKVTGEVDGSDPVNNKIISRGYNVTCEELQNAENIPARSVERAIEVTYYTN